MSYTFTKLICNLYIYKVAEASKRVWTSGCIEVIRIWAERNLYTIAGVALGVALSQVNTTKTIFLIDNVLVLSEQGHLNLRSCPYFLIITTLIIYCKYFLL